MRPGRSGAVTRWRRDLHGDGDGDGDNGDGVGGDGVLKLRTSQIS